MKTKLIFDQKGITLIELLVVLVIFGIIIGGVYRLFVAQSKAYTVQDQIVEVQQGIRSAMEILLRDLRMAGFDDDSPNSKIIVATPIIIGDEAITVSYEYDNTTLYTVAYWRDAPSQRLFRQLTTTKDDGSSIAGAQEIILENVDTLNFRYGVDKNDDKAMDDRNASGAIDETDWISAATVTAEGSKVVAIRVVLSARPVEVNPDLKIVSPRKLTSAITLRNMCM